MQEIMKAIYAAPLQGYTEAAWRNAHSEVFGGVDAYYTPFVRLEKGSIRNKDRRELLPEQNKVNRLIPQVVASEAEEFDQLVKMVTALGYREIDLNMGCPFPLIANRGKGSGLLAFPDRIVGLLEVMTHWTEVRFTVKMRLGWKEADEWKNVLPLLNRSVVQEVVLHPRIGKQQYKESVNQEEFRSFYEACELPLVYNGDLTEADAVRRLLDEYPRLKGVMLGRGLLADPSLAVALRTGVAMDRSCLYEKVYEMHRRIYAHYESVIEGGEAQLLQKMKTQWEYLLPDMDRKARKQILKSQSLERYLQGVREACRI